MGKILCQEDGGRRVDGSQRSVLQLTVTFPLLCGPGHRVAVVRYDLLSPLPMAAGTDSDTAPRTSVVGCGVSFPSGTHT